MHYARFVTFDTFLACGSKQREYRISVALYRLACPFIANARNGAKRHNGDFEREFISRLSVAGWNEAAVEVVYLVGCLSFFCTIILSNRGQLTLLLAS